MSEFDDSHESLIRVVRLGSEYFGGHPDLEELRLWVLSAHPDALLKDSRVANAQRRLIANALRQHEGGLSFAYSVGDGAWLQRTFFDASDYVSVGGGLLLQNRRNTATIEKLVAEAQERGLDVTVDDMESWADDHWNDPEESEE